MSDHRSVILCFSTLDVADGGRERCNQILRMWNVESGGDDATEWPAMISEGCSPDSVGGACECVMHFNSKYFSSDSFMQILQGLPWERPKEVELFWKGEEDETYHRTSLFAWRHANVECTLQGDCINPSMNSKRRDHHLHCDECGGRLPVGFIPKRVLR